MPSWGRLQPPRHVVPRLTPAQWLCQVPWPPGARLPGSEVDSRRVWETLEKQPMRWGLPTHGPPTVPFPSSLQEGERHLPSVLKSSVSDRSGPDSSATQRAPGPPLPREPGQAISGSDSAAVCLPTVPRLASDSYLLPAPLGPEGQREERRSLTLTQLLQEGSSVLHFFPWRWGRDGGGLVWPHACSYLGILQ